MEFEIVKMNKSHIQAIAEIEKECFSTPWSEKSLSDELKNGHARFFVAVSGGKVIGYIGAFNVFGEVSLTNIAVKSEYRKSGVGSALLEKLESVSISENAEFITLEVRASNEAAIKLYEKQGFSPSGFRKDFYQKPVEDAIIMKKSALVFTG